MAHLTEFLPEVFSRSKRLVLDFNHIPENTPDEENIKHFFTEMEREEKDPKLPEHRQRFNDEMLKVTGARYLVGAYGEDRIAMLRGSSIAKEERTLHLGVDIFSRNLEPVIAPCDGEIVRVDREDEPHSFGNYVILDPTDERLPYLFFGHLSFDVPKIGAVKQGQVIATIGDYRGNENGGWSRHLHLQCLQTLPPAGLAPLGYGTLGEDIRTPYPDPLELFTDWVVKD